MKKILLAIFMVLCLSITTVQAYTADVSPNPISININTNAPSSTVLTITDYQGELTDAEFYIYTRADYEANGEGATPTNELVGKFMTEGIYQNSSTGADPDVAGGNQWTFYVKDGIDIDDTTQSTQQYVVRFVVNGEDSGIYPIEVGADLYIPEFPTIALPVAAILGLAFFMQRRKDE
jgi:hypothetical protein